MRSIFLCVYSLFFLYLSLLLLFVAYGGGFLVLALQWEGV